MNLVIEEEFRLAEITPDGNTVNLQAIESINAFGAVTLLCLIQSRSTTQHQRLLPGRAGVQQHLANIGFFAELKRRCNDHVTWDNATIPTPAAANGNEVFSAVRYGHPGDEKRVADDFRVHFAPHGYSENLLNVGGCIIGEAGDNSRDHAHCPSHFMAGGTLDPRRLGIGIADIGTGILNAFRENEEHAQLGDERALLTSLLARKSGRQEPKRGNGLTELLKWTMTLNGTLRIDSGGRSLRIACGGAAPTYHPAACDALLGTRIGVTLEDRGYTEVPRIAANALVERFLREL